MLRGSAKIGSESWPLLSGSFSPRLLVLELHASFPAAHHLVMCHLWPAETSVCLLNPVLGKRCDLHCYHHAVALAGWCS